MAAKKTFKESFKSTLFWLAIVYGLRSFLMEPFAIPSCSMVPTLLVGDYLYVSKFAYGYSYHSFLFAPKFFSGRIMGKSPKTGDVAVFMKDSVRYVKRVIGIPGDVVELKKGILYINGVECPQKPIEGYVTHTVSGRTKTTHQYIEKLPNGKEHPILREDPEGKDPVNNMGPFHVPEGYYFMLGDNRDNSGDSRFSMGMISYEDFIGQVEFTFFSIDSSILDLWKVWKLHDIIRFKRIFSWIN